MTKWMPKSLNYKAKIVKERRLNRKARIQRKKCAEHVHTHIYMYCAMIVRAGDNPNIGITAGIAISPVLVLLWCHRVSPSLWCVSAHRGWGGAEDTDGVVEDTLSTHGDARTHTMDTWDVCWCTQCNMHTQWPHEMSMHAQHTYTWHAYSTHIHTMDT